MLVLDDIHIPTINNLFRFLAADVMFELETVRDRTAFFRRTAGPPFDPWQDGWWLQRFNKQPKLRYVWTERLKNLVPDGMRRSARSAADTLRLKFRARGKHPRG
jgi:hypothetical protein